MYSSSSEQHQALATNKIILGFLTIRALLVATTRPRRLKRHVSLILLLPTLSLFGLGENSPERPQNCTIASQMGDNNGAADNSSRSVSTEEITPKITPRWRCSFKFKSNKSNNLIIICRFHCLLFSVLVLYILIQILNNPCGHPICY